jgi:hypothetical protein
LISQVAHEGDDQDLWLRGDKIVDLVQPLLAEDATISYAMPVIKTDLVVFSLFAGATSPSSHYDTWRFRTRRPDILAQYYEQWMKLDPDSSSLHMERAYLHFFRSGRDANDEDQLLCLHCDPVESDTIAGNYRRGPHLHLSCIPRLSRAHVALSDGFLPQVLQSPTSLTDAYTRAIAMIASELLGNL